MAQSPRTLLEFPLHAHRQHQSHVSYVGCMGRILLEHLPLAPRSRSDRGISALTRSSQRELTGLGPPEGFDPQGTNASAQTTWNR